MTAVSPPTTQRTLVTAAMLLAMFMAAIEGTIVATAMPRIIADLGGFTLYSWVFSAYLLTQVVGIPIYGKLADLYGRKPVFVVGAALFLIGSVLCGQSRTMLQLIGFRALQGIGSGAVQPIATTVVGDLYSAEERHRVQGWMSSVWAISAIAGPALGGFIVDVLHWSWIFYLNVPLGVLAIAGVLTFLHETGAHRSHAIDYAGAMLLVASLSSLMLALLQGGNAWGWASLPSLGLFALAILSFLGLLRCEGRAKEPILPLWLFRERLIAVGGAVSFFNGATLLGFSAMVPTYVQGVLGGSALVAGFALAAMSIGWPLASFMSGRVMRAIGFKRMAVLGGALTVIGSASVALLAPWGAGWITAGIFVLGMGLGFLSNALIITIQSAVGWSERGVATANIMFMRTLGSTVGVAALGALLNGLLAHQLTTAGLAAGGKAIDLINQLLEPARRAALGTSAQALIQALSSGMRVVFAAACGLALVGWLLAALLPASAREESQAVG